MDTILKIFGIKKTEYSIRKSNPVLPKKGIVNIIIPDSMKTVQSVLIKQKFDTERHLNLRNEYLTKKYYTIADKRAGYKSLSKRNTEMLKVLDEIMCQPDDKSQKWWDEYFRDLNKYRFRI